MLSHALFTTRSLAAHSYHIPLWDLGQGPPEGGAAPFNATVSLPDQGAHLTISRMDLGL